MRLDWVLVSLQFRLRGAGLFLFVCCLVLLGLVRFDSCVSYIDVWLGVTPLAFLFTTMNLCALLFFMPKDPLLADAIAKVPPVHSAFDMIPLSKFLPTSCCDLEVRGLEVRYEQHAMHYRGCCSIFRGLRPSGSSSWSTATANCMMQGRMCSAFSRCSALKPLAKLFISLRLCMITRRSVPHTPPSSLLCSHLRSDSNSHPQEEAASIAQRNPEHSSVEGCQIEVAMQLYNLVSLSLASCSLLCPA